MTDLGSSPPSPAETLSHLYPTGGSPATPALRGILRRKIAENGPIPFTEFMATSLYHPELGYYARRTGQVGRAGDFYTSVSVGPLFGRLLARRFLAWWRAASRPEKWRIIECGAHDGTLADDILGELARLDPAAAAALEYAIPEPLPVLRAAQEKNLSTHGNVRHFETAEALAAAPLPGIAFGNEVLDALPFHVIERRDGVWRECLVDATAEEQFIWTLGNPFEVDLPEDDGDFPEGYRTEVRRCFSSFYAPLLAGLTHGLLIWPDYGFCRADYYLTSRTTGTLRTFSKHQAAEDPLADPGEVDITAHVDFTAAARAAMALGCRPLAWRTQSTWLTNLAKEWLISMEGNPDMALLRQFQSLTHPGHLGAKFHVLELAWQEEGEMDPVEWRRLME